MYTCYLTCLPPKREESSRGSLISPKKQKAAILFQSLLAELPTTIVAAEGDPQMAEAPESLRQTRVLRARPRGTLVLRRAKLIEIYEMLCVAIDPQASGTSITAKIRNNHTIVECHVAEYMLSACRCSEERNQFYPSARTFDNTHATCRWGSSPMRFCVFLFFVSADGCLVSTHPAPPVGLYNVFVPCYYV